MHDDQNVDNLSMFLFLFIYFCGKVPMFLFSEGLSLAIQTIDSMGPTSMEDAKGISV